MPANIIWQKDTGRFTVTMIRAEAVVEYELLLGHETRDISAEVLVRNEDYLLVRQALHDLHGVRGRAADVRHCLRRR